MPNLTPIGDEQAKAIAEALKTLQGLGGFLRQTFGTVPEDLVGILGGDLLAARRIENLGRIMEKSQAKLHLTYLTPKSSI
jgi:hypothetical protein